MTSFSGMCWEGKKVLLSKDRVLAKTYEEFERCTQDQEVRELAYARERFQLDQRSSLKIARQDGFKKVWRKARRKARWKERWNPCGS
jgi:hypothetical protein